LQYAACLGSSFSVSTLELIWKKHALISTEHVYDSVTPLLDVVLEENFIEIRGDQQFRWVHDKVQEAVLSRDEASALLGGRLFETMGDRAKRKFVTEAMGFAKMDTPSGWRQLKALIKKAFGGKKRDTDFNQKPTYTKWEALDRI
jgi:hypothetical protein